MVAGRFSELHLTSVFPRSSRARETMASGPHLRGAAPPPEDVGFGGAIEAAVKATMVKVA